MTAARFLLVVSFALSLGAGARDGDTHAVNFSKAELRMQLECKPSSCVSLEDFDLERRQRIPLEQPAVEAELVVSHCTHPLDWISRVRSEVRSTGLNLSRVTIYSKCGHEEVARHLDARVVVLPNVGRCDHSWAFHLATAYASLADVVLFMKDSTFDYPLLEGLII